MPISPVKPGGWALEEALTSDQMNDLQDAIVNYSVANDAAVAALDAELDLKAKARQALIMRRLDLTTDDLGASMAASLKGNSLPPAAHFGAAVLVKVDSVGVFQAYDANEEVDTGGVVASITSLARDAATNGTRIVAIGVGGNRGAYTDDGGGSWTATVAGIGGAVERIVYSQLGARFICGGSGTGSVYFNSNGSTGTWTSTASGFAAPLGLAVLGTGSFAGRIVVLGNSGVEPRFSYSTDHAVSFTVAGTTVPNAALAAEPGDIAAAPNVDILGVGGTARVYHIARGLGGSLIRTNHSPDGQNWTAGSTLAAVGWTYASRPRLFMCQSTGLFVIVAPTSDGTCALYASFDFIIWAGPAMVKSAAIEAFAVAGGKLFMTRGDSIYGSAGARF